ncbi:MAG: sigma-E factor negative regulatory protein, partial [Steroidobacteraceae bacterium]
AFLDGELPDEEMDLFIRRLERDGALKRSLSRYALMGEVMRTPANGGGVVAGSGFASRVSAAIEADSGASDESGQGAAGSTARPRRFGPLAGLSIAAGVAVVAVGLMNRAPDAPQSVATVVDRTVASDPSLSEASYVVPEITVTGPLVPSARLTNYVMAHSEYSSPIGRRNVLSNMLSDDSMSPDAVIPAGFVPDEGPARQVSP